MADLRHSWLRITLPGRCAAVRVNSFGFVVETAPVYGWMLHKHESEIVRWANQHHGEIERLTNGKENQAAKD